MLLASPPRADRLPWRVAATRRIIGVVIRPPAELALIALLLAACAAKNDSHANANGSGAGGASAQTSPPVDTMRGAARSPESRAVAAHTPASSSAASAARNSPQTTGRRCGGNLLDVMVRRDALGEAPASLATTDSMLRAESARILRPVAGLVTAVDVSPAIRTFRVHLADSVSPPTVDRVKSVVRAAKGVEDVSNDDCSMHVDRPQTTVPSKP
jgi:hypothetical protein